MTVKSTVFFPRHHMHSWSMPSEKEMVFLRVNKLPSILGMIIVVQTMTTSANWERKRYLGLWSLGLEKVAARMAVLPTGQKHRKDKKKEEMEGKKPSIINIVTELLFFITACPRDPYIQRYW